ncbi:MAG TPA: FHA domain-containing protein [Kofleriaceae bacterium]|nr:FHA domain-containing protein [Kofleriaceae bacterium]
MFLKYFEFIFAPFRAINNKIIGVKNIKGNIQVDINRSKSLAARGKNFAGKVNNFNQQAQGQQPGQQPQAQGQPQQYQQGGYYMQQPGQGMPPGGPGIPGYQQPGAPGAPGQPGMPQQPGLPNPNPPIRTKGFWIFKKKFCTQCEQQLDKTWDQCPFCAQIAQQAAIPPAQRQAMKTQAFVMDATGGPGAHQLLGWIVPLQGAQRGELFTLAPVTTIGTDAKCTIVLNDKFMSSRHAEIKAENGVWVLRDSGSTNGTYVNNRRVDRHELVDNDFIKFGSAMLKFKSL